jgi:Tfp pilus assembly protein PilN
MPIEEVRYATHATDKGKLLAIAVPENVITPYEDALKAAGCKAIAAYVTTQGLLALVPPSKEPVALAVTLEEAVEVLVAAEDRILMTSNIAIEKLPEAEIGEQISRALMSYLSRSADQHVSKLYLTDTRAGVRSKLLKPIPVETLDLSKIVEAKSLPEDLIGAAGIAVGLSTKRVPMAELARPPAAVKKFELKQSLRVAGLVGAIAILAVIWLHMEASDREDEALKANQELAAKQKQLKIVQKLKDEKAEVERWASSRPIWPETLLELSNLIDTKEAYVVSATFEEDQSMTINGRAKRRETVTSLRQKLEDSKLLYDVSAPNITPTTSKDEFNVEFTIKARVQP